MRPKIAPISQAYGSGQRTEFEEMDESSISRSVRKNRQKRL